MPDWTLAIDFGTTYTVAAVAENGSATLLDPERNGANQLRSSVWVDDDGAVIAGSDATDRAASAPDRFEETPRRWIAEGEVALGGQLVPVSKLVAAVIGKVAREACTTRNGDPPSSVRLTHPAEWGSTRTDVLRDAAARAGLGQVELLAEPVAAVANAGGARLRPGEQLAVYDFGGATFDAIVLVRTDSGFETAGPPGGRDPLGGRNLDQRIIDYLGAGPAGAHGDWPLLVEPPDERWLRAALEFRECVRLAKEALSASNASDIFVPGLELDVQLTRSELEELIAPDIEATLDVLAETIAAAETTKDKLEGIFVVGGSSNIPLVPDAIWRRFGRRPGVCESPGAAVALGAATWRTRVARREPGPPLARRDFRSRLAMATRTRLWNDPVYCYAHLALDGDGLSVRVSDEPLGGATAEDLAASAVERWRETPGYTELAYERATVLGRDGGFERRMAIAASDEWFERYVDVDGRGLVLTSRAGAEAVADSVRVGRPTLDPSRHYEPAFTAAVPPGWTVRERVELVRSGTGHSVVAEGFPLDNGLSGSAWAERFVQELATERGLAIGSSGRGRVFGREQGLVWTLHGDGGEATRIWVATIGDRAYALTASLSGAPPESERVAFWLLSMHAVLASR